MARATNVPVTRRRHRRYLKAAKGFFGGRSRLYRPAREAVERAWGYSTAHRRSKKRDFRQLWNARITAGARESGISYSRLMGGLRRSNVLLNRKSISEIAQFDPKAFQELVKLAQSA
jgi:large subunit ribosomal protein L20